MFHPKKFHNKKLVTAILSELISHKTGLGKMGYLIEI